MTAIGSRTLDQSILWFCGASLISEDFLVTAAHCVPKTEDKVGSLVARVGDTNLIRDDDGSNPQEFGIKQIFVHPQYKNLIKYHDIALMELDRKAM
jgi:secreted trypsin-like serine protease